MKKPKPPDQGASRIIGEWLQTEARFLQRHAAIPIHSGRGQRHFEMSCCA
jgi:hypothetical protein